MKHLFERKREENKDKHKNKEKEKVKKKKKETIDPKMFKLFCLTMKEFTDIEIENIICQSIFLLNFTKEK